MSDAMNENETGKDTGHLLELASEIVAAYVSNNPIPMAEVPGMIRAIHSALGDLETGAKNEPATAQKPFVPIKRSVTDEHIICLEDGKPLKMLKRYLRTHYDLTPEQYRAKWGLPADYPMVAPAYARTRSDHAKRIGLGRAGAASKAAKKR